MEQHLEQLRGTLALQSRRMRTIGFIFGGREGLQQQFLFFKHKWKRTFRKPAKQVKHMEMSLGEEAKWSWTRKGSLWSPPLRVRVHKHFWLSQL